VERYLGMIGRALRLLLYVMLPIAALGMVLREDIVDLLFQYGAFNQQAVEMTAAVLLVLLIGLAAHSMIAVLARAFYADQDTMTPVVAAIGAVIVNVTVAVVAVRAVRVAGAGLRDRRRRLARGIGPAGLPVAPASNAGRGQPRGHVHAVAHRSAPRRSHRGRRTDGA
jgi:peptidoglycan biosynthesis protein MviN/MurJ (putative lipid II flippase)